MASLKAVVVRASLSSNPYDRASLPLVECLALSGCLSPNWAIRWLCLRCANRSSQDGDLGGFSCLLIARREHVDHVRDRLYVEIAGHAPMPLEDHQPTGHGSVETNPQNAPVRGPSGNGLLAKVRLLSIAQLAQINRPLPATRSQGAGQVRENRTGEGE